MSDLRGHAALYMPDEVEDWVKYGLGDRFGMSAADAVDMFDSFRSGTKSWKDIAQEAYDVEKRRADVFQLSRIGNVKIMHNDIMPNGPSTSYSTIHYATANPQKIKMSNSDDVVWDYGDFILNPGGWDTTTGRICDTGGCVPRAAHALYDGRFTYNEIKEGMNQYNISKERKPNSFMDYKKWARTNDGTTTSGGSVDAAASLYEDMVLVKPYFKWGTHKKGVINTLMEHIPNFMLSASYDRGVPHAYGFYDGRPVSIDPFDMPLQIVSDDLRNTYSGMKPVRDINSIVMPEDDLIEVAPHLRRWQEDGGKNMKIMDHTGKIIQY